IDDLAFAGFSGERAYQAFRDLQFDSLIERLGLEKKASAPKLELEVEEVSAEELLKTAKLLFAHWDGETLFLSSSLANERSFARLTLSRAREHLEIDLGGLELLVGDNLKELFKIAPVFKTLKRFDLRVAAYILGLYRSEDLATELERDLRDVAELEFPSQSAQRVYLSSDQSSEAALAELMSIETLYPVLQAAIEARGIEVLAEEVEMPLISLLAEMEERGIALDRAVLDELEETFLKRIAEVEKSIYARAGYEFNLNSTQQLSKFLFEDLGLKGKKKKNASGFYSTAASVLEEMIDEDPVIEEILDYRQMSKLQSTFIQGLRDAIKADGRVHTHFHQCLTSTGRLSSSDPNLQNIPIRSEMGREIRRAFVAKENYVLIDADYSQIELRVLAGLAEDRAMITAFRDHRDIHEETARALFSAGDEEVTGLQRAHAKTVNFSVVYGVSAYGLAKNLQVSVAAAQRYIDHFYQQYPGILDFMNGSLESAREHGYVESMMGRRRYVPEVQASAYMQRKAGERQAINMPIQGSAADLMKLAMLRAQNAFDEAGIDAAIISQVHDEILVEAHHEIAEEAAEILKRSMENVIQFNVPLEVDIQSALNWAEAH
ncbi:MAG: DNA polymerase, partial [Eubacteriales bacterium]|nr:DNA polymerase [Eubacteriales bacterium]